MGSKKNKKMSKKKQLKEIALTRHKAKELTTAQSENDCTGEESVELLSASVVSESVW